VIPRFVFKLYIRLPRKILRIDSCWFLCQRPLAKKRILRDKRDIAYNMKTVDNSCHVYVIYFNPSSSISPFKTLISIEVHGRWNLVFLSRCVHTGTLGRLMSSTNSLLLRRVFTPFIVDSIISLPSTPPSPSISEVELRKLDFGSFHPTEKKTCILRSEYELTKEHPIRVEQPTPLVIYEREKREIKRRRWI